MDSEERDNIKQLFIEHNISFDLFEDIERLVINSCKECTVDFTSNQAVFSVYGGFAYVWISERQSDEDYKIVLSLYFNKKVDSSLFYSFEQCSDSSFMYHCLISQKEDLNDELKSYIKKAAEISRVEYFKQIV
ncbi:MAG: DUF5655 domain-containing protein [Sphaerochaetaceae bacterium]|nr:DUF5655 domain-containing protein [Sphaerochaetaceae bacterium]